MSRQRGCRGQRPPRPWHLIKKLSLLSTVVEQPSSLSRGPYGVGAHRASTTPEYTRATAGQSHMVSGLKSWISARVGPDGTAPGPLGHGENRCWPSWSTAVLQDPGRSSRLGTRCQREALHPGQLTALPHAQC